MKRINGNEVVVNKGCHSRTFLSGIYNACRCKIKENSLLDKCVEDPRYQLSGMTPLFNNGGFTLIELLVVVLIIGILAAVAVPQYNKAVWKARMTNVLTFGANAEKVIDLHLLEKGWADTADKITFFTGTSANNSTGIDLISGLTCKESTTCQDQYFRYQSAADTDAYWQVSLLESPVDSYMWCGKFTITSDWECSCVYDTLHGKEMCDILKQSRGGTVLVSGSLPEED